MRARAVTELDTSKSAYFPGEGINALCPLVFLLSLLIYHGSCLCFGLSIQWVRKSLNTVTVLHQNPLFSSDYYSVTFDTNVLQVVMPMKSEGFGVKRQVCSNFCVSIVNHY